MRVKIGEYFKRDFSSKTSRDYEESSRIRAKINSFKDEKDINAWLFERRQSSYNRLRDRELFGIPEDSKVEERVMSKTNRYYDRKNDIKEENEKASNAKAGKGKTKKAKTGKGGDHKSSKMSNLLNNTLNKTKPGKAIKFIITNIEILFKIFLVVLILIIVGILTIYIGGTLSSIGQTPFVLCQNNSIMDPVNRFNYAGGSINQNVVPIIATKDYACQVFIYTAKHNGWTDDAIVGVLSYILQEGSAMGTFTYEGCYKWTGPSGTLYDTTLDNALWEQWLPTSGKEQAHPWYSENTSHYAAIGLGLLQNSDVWQNDGTMDAAWATDLIEFAKKANKSWQDPQTQMNYFFENVFARETAFDEVGISPTLDDRTPEEWCRRITAGVGMPAMGWEDDDQYMEDHLSHLDEAQDLLDNYTGVAMVSLSSKKINELCKGSNASITTGNSSIAAAAVSLAGSDAEDEYIEWDIDGVDSTNLNDDRLKTYKTIHVTIFPGDIYFADCGRSAACAIRWSGADDTFPAGDTAIQYNYLLNSTKWALMGLSTNVELKPGDILITEGKGHIKIFVGNIIAQTRFPGSKADMYCGAYQSFFPVLYEECNYDIRRYVVFRCVVPDNSNTYNNIAVG